MKYDCNNNPRRTTGGSYPVQDGWTYNDHGGGGTATREPVIVMQADRMTSPCVYDKSATDAWCDGCARRKRTALKLPPSVPLHVKCTAIRLRAMGRDGVTLTLSVEFLRQDEVIYSQDMLAPYGVTSSVAITDLGPNCGTLTIDGTMDLNGFNIDLPQIKRTIGTVFLSPGESIDIDGLDAEIKILNQEVEE